MLFFWVKKLVGANCLRFCNSEALRFSIDRVDFVSDAPVAGFLMVAPAAPLTQSCFNNFAISFCCRNLSTQHPLTGKINQMISCKSKEQLFQKIKSTSG